MATTAANPSGATFERALPYVAAAIALGAALLLIQPYPVGVFHDDGAYAILAKSIAEGNGFRFLQLPGGPAAIHYPPLWPMLLSAVWWIWPQFPANVTPMLALNALFLAATAWNAHRLAVRVLGWSAIEASVAAVIATVSYPLLILSGILVSEPMFIAALLALIPVAESMVTRPHERWKFLPFGLACGALALIRTHGLALPAAVMLILVWRRQWRETAMCAGGLLVALVPWQLWQVMHAADLPATLRGSYGSYVGWFVEGLSTDGFIGRTLATNARAVWSLLGGRFALVDSTFVMKAVPALVIGALIYGAFRMARRAPVFIAFTAIYLVIVMFWPYDPWRFVFGIWPVFILLLGEAARDAAGRVRRRELMGAVIAVPMIVLMTGVVVRESRAIRERSWSVPAKVAGQQTIPSLMWILRNTTESDLVASEVPELVYLYTGRRSVPVMPFNAGEYGVPRSVTLDATNLQLVVAELPVTYVVTISDLRAAASSVRSPSLTRIADTVTTHAIFRVTR